MNETKGLVKCVLGFVLSILVMVGAAFGLDVKVNVQDAEVAPPEVVETTETNAEEVDAAEDEQVLATEEVVETEQSTVETTETVDQEPTVEESVENEVTVPTDETQEQ